MNRPIQMLAAILLATSPQWAAAKCFTANVCDEHGKNCSEQQVCPTYQGGADLKTRGATPPPETSEAPKSLLSAPAATKPPCALNVPKGKKVEGCE